MTTQAVASLQAEVNKLRHELQTLKVHGESSSLAGETLYVGQYLVERLAQLGVTVRAAQSFRVCLAEEL